MSNLDPFGSSSARTFGARKVKSDFGGAPANVLNSANNAVRDVFSQMSSKKTRGWAKASEILCVVNLSIGALTCAWAFLALMFHAFMPHCLVLGGSLLIAGFVGLLALRSDSPGIKSAHISSAIFVGMVAWAFLTLVTVRVRDDCILAETYLRLDHLETAIQNNQHGEMISGIMMRLDHLHEDIGNLQNVARDHVKELEDRKRFQSQDMMYIDEKLRDLAQLADEAFQRLDAQAYEMQRNITEIEAFDETNMTEDQRRQRTQQKARLRTLKYRLKALEPKKQSLRDLATRIEEHADEGNLSWDEYVNIISVLEKNIMDRDLVDSLKDEKNEMPHIKDSMVRAERNEYDTVEIGDYAARARNRTVEVERKRAKYEQHMANAIKRHDKKLNSRDKYLRSLSEYLEAMPEHCEQDLEDVRVSAMIGWVALALAGATTYAAMTSTVASIKKDF